MNKQTFPLHKVVHYRNVRKIKILLPETKDINAKDEKGQTVLLIASEQELNNDAIMELLLSHEKIDPEVTNEDNFNVLHMLAFKGKLTWIEKLFEKFPNMSVDAVTDKGNTPLMLATKMDHLGVIRYLHSKGADIDHKNSKNFTALLYAANNGYEETTKELLKLGAVVDHKDDYGFTPLMKAASWSFTEVCEILLGHNADSNIENNRGQTALTQSIRRKNSDIVEILLKHGSNPNHVVSSNGRLFTPLVFACSSRSEHIMQLLIDYGADVNYPKPYSLALFICIKKRFIPGVKVLLLNADVNIHARDPRRDTALKCAREYGYHEIVTLLENYSSENYYY